MLRLSLAINPPLHKQSGRSRIVGVIASFRQLRCLSHELSWRIFMRSFVLAFLLIPIVAGVWPSFGVTDINNHAAVQKDLQFEYKEIEMGFRHDDPTPWIERLSPGFELVLFSGQHQSRQWAVDYVRNNAKTFHIVRLSMRIQRLEFGESEVTATVEQKSERTFSEDGQPHRLNVGALQRETWEPTDKGWRLKRVQEWKVLYVRNTVTGDRSPLQK